MPSAACKAIEMQTLVTQIKENGDVTLPEEVRRRLGKDTVEFVIRDDGVVELRRPSLSLDDVFGSIPARPGMSDDFDAEIEAAIEEHIAEKYKQLPR
jgi:bifunctional DNA-binding transcriptional regulator/antitoxin component of YhaV-PrlF toxin-antitoxin module